ncbi:MAG: hypothetical protein JOZ75_11260 [Candidatus Dormibacteraeota bacterium]|nr:hypothetical protein [Candidatus Dormibacteraeota bacterium]
MSSLTEPMWAESPPLKVNVDSRVLGLVIGIISLVACLAWLLVSITGLWIVGSVNPYCSSIVQEGTGCGSTSGIFALGLIGFLLVVAGYLLVAAGGFRMFAMVHEAKRQAIYGLLLGVIGGLIATIGYGGFLSVLIFDVVLALVVYYLIVVSRYPDEEPLVPYDTRDDTW